MSERDRITELEHRIGQATEEAESMALEGGVARACALRFLAALEVPVAEWPVAPEAAVADAAVTAPDDTPRDRPASHGQAQPHAGAFLPAAVPDRETLREAISAAIDDAWWSEGPKPSERVMGIVWPVLEHAQEAAAGSHEGVRLWMLDCGELAAKHRARAEAAEGKLASLRTVLLEGGQGAATARRRALAIIGTGEENRY